MDSVQWRLFKSAQVSTRSHAAIALQLGSALELFQAELRISGHITIGSQAYEQIEASFATALRTVHEGLGDCRSVQQQLEWLANAELYRLQTADTSGTPRACVRADALSKAVGAGLELTMRRAV